MHVERRAVRVVARGTAGRPAAGRASPSSSLAHRVERVGDEVGHGQHGRAGVEPVAADARSSTPARPPGTARAPAPSPAGRPRPAAARPTARPSPAPTTTTWSVGPVTVRIRPRALSRGGVAATASSREHRRAAAGSGTLGRGRASSGLPSVSAGDQLPRPSRRARRCRRCTSRSASTPSASRPRVAEQAPDEPRACAGRGALERQRDEHGALALAQVVAGRLARLRGVAEDARGRRRAAGTPRRAAARTREYAASRLGAGAGQRGRRGAAGARPCTWRSCSGPPAGARVAPSRRWPRACSSRSRYCPAMSSVRISSKTGSAARAAARPEPAGRAAARRPRTGTGRRARIARAAPNALAGRRASRRRGAAPRTAGARRAARGGCRSRPSRRRGSARTPAAAPARSPPRTVGLAVGAAGAAPAPVAERRPQPLAAGEQVGDGLDERRRARR